MKQSRGDRGATTAEYGLLIAATVFALFVGVEALKLALNLFYASMSGSVDNWD